MPQTLTARLTQAREAWQRIARPQQIALLVGLAIAVALSVGFFAWSQQTNYGVLFSNLQTQDSSAIVTKLKAQKIPYELQDGGATILVPTSLVDDTRLMLAGDNLPNQGTVGFEIFDNTNPLGMTDFTQQVDYQRALQGELTRTIQQINGVAQAWVNIVLPQSSLYTSSQQDPTASITLRLNPGVALDPGQVKAIMHLVASSVQGMKPSDVTVVDTDGNNLSDEVNNSTLSNGVTAATYGTALDVERTYESQLSQQASSMLSTVLGPGKAVVRVNALLNWDQLQQDSTTYGQQPNQIASQSTNNITSNGAATQTAGAPGTGSNLVPTPTTTAGSGGNTYSQSQTNTVYDVSQTVEHLTKAPGSVQRLTVAVFLDGQYPATTISAIQQAVGNAIGLNASRGDQITVSAIPFNHATDTAAKQALVAQQQQATLETLWRGTALALVAMALLIFALRASRRMKSRVSPSTVTLINDQAVPLDQLQSAAAQGELPDGQPTESGLIMLASSPDDMLAAAKQQQLTEAEQQHRAEIKENLVSIAQNHPEMLANVIQNWFDE